MATLVEYLAPIAGGTAKDKVVAVLYYRERVNKVESLATSDIRDALREARVPGHAGLRIDNAIRTARHFVHSPGKRGRQRLWQITQSGKKYVKGLLGDPAPASGVHHDVSALSAVVAKISDDHVRSYVQESLTCLEAGARRAAVVFLWSAAIREIENSCLAKGKTALNAALTKFYSKARTVSTIDHFSYIKDTITIKAAQELGIFDKSEWETVDDALKLRNRCGHPAKYSIGEKKVSSYIEDLLSVVFK